MKRSRFVLVLVVFLVVGVAFGQPALPDTDEGNVVLPIGHVVGIVVLVFVRYGLHKLNK